MGKAQSARDFGDGVDRKRQVGLQYILRLEERLPSALENAREKQELARQRKASAQEMAMSARHPKHDFTS